MQTNTYRQGRNQSSHSGRRRSFSSTARGGRNQSQSQQRSGGYNRSGGNSRHGSNRSQGNGGGFRRGNSGGGKRGRVMPTFNPSQFINTNPVDIAEEVYKSKHTFTTFGLDKRLEGAVLKSGLQVPTPIQDQIIPEILNGHDVVGLAETGTGKTAAFLLPLIHMTLREYKRQTLILAPTRELALQIDAELKKYATGMRLYSTICVGGTSIGPQIRSLKRMNHFVIGTPGRILDLINRGFLAPQKVTSVVLDEADRMLDMGFIHDMRKILEDVPKEAETLLFSATMQPEAKKLVNDFLTDPVHVSVKKKDVTNSIAQDVVPYEAHTKFNTLTDLLKDESFTRVIIFGAMKHSVEKLAKELTDHGIVAQSIHGNKNHTQRQRALSQFKSGNARVLVATDVAARGIHVDNVSHVINYDLPNTFEDYVHRIGRTGRGSKKGMALTFVPKTVIAR